MNKILQLNAETKLLYTIGLEIIENVIEQHCINEQTKMDKKGLGINCDLNETNKK
jgi:hypothetical protein